MLYVQNIINVQLLKHPEIKIDRETAFNFSILMGTILDFDNFS